MAIFSLTKARSFGLNVGKVTTLLVKVVLENVVYNCLKPFQAVLPNLNSLNLHFMQID